VLERVHTEHHHDSFVARANIDHFLGLLRVEIVAETRATLNSLLIEELSKLGSEHVQYVERAVANYRLHIERLVTWRAGLTDGSPEQRSADNMLLDFKMTLKIMDGIYTRMREMTVRFEHPEPNKRRAVCGL
jgi:hypothetical protein